MSDSKDINFDLQEKPSQTPMLKVIGVGGGGGNAVSHMIRNQVEGVEFVCANTDAQVLSGFKPGTATILQLGADLTKGLGAGGNPELGRQAALEDRDRIADTLNGADMVFIAAGMGGGTGTGGAPVVAEIARDLGVLAVAVVTKPFEFERKERAKIAEEGIKELGGHVDSLITIPNERLLQVLGGDVSMLKAFGAANDVLQGAVKGIADLILKPGLINLDFADVRAVMGKMGMAMMGTGQAKGAERARVAAEAAIRSPLLEDVHLDGAKGVLVNITAGEDLGLNEYREAGDIVKEFASEDATVMVGTVIDKDMGEEVLVTVVATGFSGRPSASLRPRVVVNNKQDLDTPTVLRKPPGGSPMPAAKAAAGGSGAAPDYLDVPAFLRRQAD